jgi:hypothetical protein
MTSETPEKVETTQAPAAPAVEPDTYHSPNGIFRIAIWAGWISWAFLVIALVNFGLRIYNNIYPAIQAGQFTGMNAVYYSFNEIYMLLFYAFIFLVLQGVSQGLYILMDIFEAKSGSEAS